jgi:hypothetical protein
LLRLTLFPLFLLYALNSFALEISLESAKEKFQPYSTLHLKDINDFLCQNQYDDFGNTTKIVCVFSKKPSQKIKKLQNNFFQIDTKVQESGFFLIIKPLYKMQLFALVFDMTEEGDVYQADVKLSKHWMIVGYIDKLPYIKNHKPLDIGINFPFTMKKDSLPYVGGLDLKGNPVHIEKAQDVKDYVKIKKYYKNKKYYKCLELIDSIIANYPNTLFRVELLFYKIRANAKLNDFDKVIDLSKVYLREYSADENVAEVLALSANAYAKVGLNIDADYFFDRLFDEHKESEFAKWGYIYKGEMLEASGGASKAFIFYEKAFYAAKSVEVAADAAFHLAQQQVNNFKRKKAAKYIRKIINVMPKKLFENIKQSMELMYAFAEGEDYLTASAIAKALINEMKANHDEYERLLKDRAVWLSKTSNKQEALKALNRYIKEFKYGTYEKDVKIAKDALFFDTNNETNATQRLSQYNELIEDYANDTIGKRALYEKVKLLLEEKKYDDVLDLKGNILALDSDEYSDTDTIIYKAAIGSMQESLKDNECQNVLNISDEYNITLSNEWDDGVYRCAMKGGDFTLAKKIANLNQKSKDLELRKLWLYRYIKVDFATGNYSEVIEASKDLIILIEDDVKEGKKTEYIDIYRYLFDTYQRVENKHQMLELILNIENIFKIQSQDIERYLATMSVGTNLKDNNIIIKYATIVMQIQKKSATFVQTPFVEFTLYQAYVDKEDYNKALEIIISLDDKKLSSKQRARQKYLLGFIYSKLWRDEEAINAYEEAINADKESSWAQLAKSAKEF